MTYIILTKVTLQLSPAFLIPMNLSKVVQTLRACVKRTRKADTRQERRVWFLIV